MYGRFLFFKDDKHPELETEPKRFKNPFISSLFLKSSQDEWGLECFWQLAQPYMSSLHTFYKYKYI